MSCPCDVSAGALQDVDFFLSWAIGDRSPRQTAVSCNPRSCERVTALNMDLARGARRSLSVDHLLQRCKAFIKSITLFRNGGLNVPLPIADLVEAQSFGHLRHRYCFWKVLFVGQNQKGNSFQLILSKQPVQLLLCGVALVVVKPVNIVGVHNEDESLGSFIVVLPKRSDFFLAAD